eukprot:SAG31_NODE_1414_length_8451_cov_13.707016_8_plen_82_part_00
MTDGTAVQPLWQQVHCVARDPGLLWVKDRLPAVDAPPDSHSAAAAGDGRVWAEVDGKDCHFLDFMGLFLLNLPCTHRETRG